MQILSVLGLLAILFPVTGFTEEKIVSVYTNTEHITNMTVAGDYLWYGAWEGGAVRYNRKDDTWKVFTSADGLANNTTESIYTDTKGRVWFSCDRWGVSCCDGSSWTIYRGDNGQFDSGLVRAVCEDTAGQMWCCTTEGIYRLEGSGWVCMLEGGAGAIAAGKDGSIWTTVNNTLLRYNGSEWQVYTSKETGVGLDYIHSILIDKNNVMWFRLWGGDMACFDGKTWARPSLPDGTGSVYSFPMIGPDGNLWIMWSGNVCRFGDAKKWEIMVYNKTLRDAFSASGVNIPGNVLFSVDDDGVYWFADHWSLNGNLTPGIFRFDGSSVKVKHPDSMPFIRPAAITQDRSGNIWIGGWYSTGIYRIDGATPTVFNGVNGYSPIFGVNSIAVDVGGSVWCAASDYISRYDGNEWKIMTQLNSGLQYDTASVIFRDSKNVLWFGQQGGVSSFDGGRWNYYNKANTGINLENLNAIGEDGSGMLWVGGQGILASFDGKTWIENNPYAPEYNLSVTAFAAGKDGAFWCSARRYKGSDIYSSTWYLLKFHNSAWSMYPVPGFGSVNSIAVDRNNTVWLAKNENEGLQTFDGTTWSGYNTNDGMATAVVNTVFIDTNNMKWVGTEDGLFCIGDSLPNGIAETTGSPIPLAFFSCRPNPFNSSVVLEFTLTGRSRTEISIYTITGQYVKTLYAGNLPPGRRAFVWNGRDGENRKASSGIYLVSFRTGKHILTRKITLLR